MHIRQAKNNLRGIWLMIIGSAVLVTSDAVSKILAESYPYLAGDISAAYRGYFGYCTLR